MSDIYELEKRLNNSKRDILIDFSFGNNEIIKLESSHEKNAFIERKFILDKGYATNIFYDLILSENCIRVKLQPFELIIQGMKETTTEYTKKSLFSNKIKAKIDTGVSSITFKTIFNNQVLDIEVSVLEKGVLELDNIITDNIKDFLSKQMEIFFSKELENLKETCCYTVRGHRFTFGGSMFGDEEMEYIKQDIKSNVGISTMPKIIFSTI